MGLFYKTPADLKELESLILAVGREMAAMGRGVGNPAVLDEMLLETTARMHSERDRLLSGGRASDLKAFRKHLMSAGTFMDNAPYNQLYEPWLRKHLSA